MQAQIFQKPFIVVHTVTAAEDSANAVVIQLLPSEVLPSTDDVVFMVGHVDSTGKQKNGATASYSGTTGCITLGNGDTTLAADDVITIAWQIGTIA